MTQLTQRRVRPLLLRVADVMPAAITQHCAIQQRACRPASASCEVRAEIAMNDRWPVTATGRTLSVYLRVPADSLGVTTSTR